MLFVNFSSRCCSPIQLLNPAVRSSCVIRRGPPCATSMVILSTGRLPLGVVPFGATPPTADGLGPGLIIAAMPSNGPAGTFGLFAADPCAIAPTTIEKRLRLVCVKLNVALNNKALDPHGSDAHGEQSAMRYTRVSKGHTHRSRQLTICSKSVAAIAMVAS